MYITDSSTLGFKIPEEFEHAVDFEKEHPDWKKSESTNVISFSKTSWYDVPLKKKEDE